MSATPPEAVAQRAGPAPPGGPSYDRRTVWSWALYDFANSSYTTVIVTFVYALFFKDYMLGEGGDGTTLWTRGATVTGITVALASPYLGALADDADIHPTLEVTV